jgi:hypothetical protein
MLMAANGVQVCADFIDGVADGRPLNNATIRHVEGWFDPADVDEPFHLVNVLSEFPYGNGQFGLSL